MSEWDGTWSGLGLFEYEATSPNGFFLGTGVLEARDMYDAYDTVRAFFGERARIVMREVTEGGDDE